MIADLPDWNFQTYKVSSSIFRVTATDSLGRNVERTGTGLDELHKQVAEDAMSIERQCKQNESN
ncbi:MAG TPA: hypothetical protein VFU55_07035 [Terracidiphilus sp.]|nr:hypothetical protein [Terracidiphilus sp.]